MGAYGAAKAGSPFDLWCFLQQPQVLARFLSAISLDSGLKQTCGLSALIFWVIWLCGRTLRALPHCHITQNIKAE
uniref:Uncharacterized protein n=1 Tax=Anolis carolinensis TaxID=28377 RepID=A0A803TJ41_ANOCA